MPLILEAALAEFAQQGYGGASMASVAARVGVTKSLIYHYFSSKEDLFRATARSYIQPAHSVAERTMTEGAATALDLMRSLFEVGYDQIGKPGPHHQLMKMIITEADRFPELAQLYREEIMVPATAILRRVLQNGVASGEFRQEVTNLPFIEEILIAPVMMTNIWRLIMNEGEAPAPNGMLTTHLSLLKLAISRKPSDTEL
ncbi:TetR/AcrR family transcriptional regulator [Nitrospirillum sp. BR 11752]|uniref:TetR/AcrR family transcriptional regulator n=1 Tax=Nitrospirillum sp. BR 11752 TaxID=3104293 RepID=UPI002EA97077|nr:TetR/AcrR family transcriptional regulator [Nitrospirillum sp. BR 11752]